MAGNTATRTYTIKKRKIPKVGEIVNYTPDIPSTGYDLSTAKSGWLDAQTIDGTYDPTTWKIMEVDESGNITKLFGVPSDSQSVVGFRRSTGYNNGVYLLNDICKSRYGNASLGATARNLNIEDIESRMNSTGIVARNANKGDNNKSIQYGTTITYTGGVAKYPSIYAQEKYSGVDVSDVTAGSQVIAGEVNATAQARMNPNGKSGSDNIYTTLPEKSETTGPSKTKLTCTQTYYDVSQSSSYYDDTNFYNMIFGKETYFWLASRYVDCHSSGSLANFGLRTVYSNNLDGAPLFFSNGDGTSNSNHLAPVVSLGSGVQIKSGEGTTEKPYVIGK